MIAALALAATLGVLPADAGPITVSPENPTIVGLVPGTTGWVDIALTNTTDRTARITIIGTLRSDQPLTQDDALRIDLSLCSQPWAGVPEKPTASAAPPECGSGEVPSSSGGLPALSLEGGHTIHVLIAAGLSANAGPGAQGQTWDAELVVQTEDAAPTATPLQTLHEVALAITGGSPIATASAAGIAVVAGAAGVRARRRRQIGEM